MTIIDAALSCLTSRSSGPPPKSRICIITNAIVTPPLHQPESFFLGLLLPHVVPSAAVRADIRHSQRTQLPSLSNDSPEEVHIVPHPFANSISLLIVSNRAALTVPSFLSKLAVSLLSEPSHWLEALSSILPHSKPWCLLLINFHHLEASYCTSSLNQITSPVYPPLLPGKHVDLLLQHDVQEYCHVFVSMSEAKLIRFELKAMCDSSLFFVSKNNPLTLRVVIDAQRSKRRFKKPPWCPSARLRLCV